MTNFSIFRISIFGVERSAVFFICFEFFNSRGSEASFSADCFFEFFGGFDQNGNKNALENELGDPVSLLYFEVFFAEIEKNDSHVSPVILVNDPSTNVDTLKQVLKILSLC